jgi:hypothetical protein
MRNSGVALVGDFLGGQGQHHAGRVRAHAGGSGIRLRVVESGFASLTGPEAFGKRAEG